jgi:hypothetical protein
MEPLGSINTNKKMTKFKPGDFSFFKNFKEIFEYDFKVVDKIGEIAWNALKNYEPYTKNFVIDTINNQLYPGHTAVTYRLSINNLVFIANYGWDDFVEHSI